MVTWIDRSVFPVVAAHGRSHLHSNDRRLHVFFLRAILCLWWLPVSASNSDRRSSASLRSHLCTSGWLLRLCRLHQVLPLLYVLSQCKLCKHLHSWDVRFGRRGCGTAETIHSFTSIRVFEETDHVFGVLARVAMSFPSLTNDMASTY